MAFIALSASELSRRTDTLEALLREGSAIVMRFFRSAALRVTTKDDNTPVTEADLASSAFFIKALESAFGDPVISEEDLAQLPPPADRKGWNRVWYVDPLDATQNFFAGSEEFAIVVGLIECGRPVLGGIAIPAKNLFVIGGSGIGAWRCSADTKFTIRCNPNHATALMPGNPSSKGKCALAQYFAGLGFEGENVRPLGSAYRSALIASGEAAVTGSFDRVGLWDLAGAEAVITAAGGSILEVPAEQPIFYDPAGPMYRAGYVCRAWS